MFRAWHAGYMRDFLTTLRGNRRINIVDGRFHYGILENLKLTGNEQRPFTDDEIRQVLQKYGYFKAYFTSQGLWMDDYGI